MLKQFYEKALPSQGVYCVSGLSSGRMANRFAETLDGVLEEIEKLKDKKADVFVALGTFEGYSRKADDCLFVRSFFIDLDVGEGKEYASKADAHTALYKLQGAAELPDPVVIDSGGGIHAYWIMDTDIPKDEWKPAAEVFKALCLQHIAIDPVVTADAARIMRCPETFNYKTGTPRPTSVISDEISVYSWDEFRSFLMGEEGEVVVAEPRSVEIENILASVPKGLDDDAKAILKLDNFPRTFETLKEKLPSILDDFKKYYVFYNKNPEFAEYQQMFDNIKGNLQKLNSELFMTTNNIEKDTETINDKLRKLDILISKEKQKNRQLKRKLGIIETKYNGSDELINNYKEIYNLDYLRNFALFMGIVLSFVIVAKTFKSPTTMVPTQIK
jgi:hypothetical protein